MALILSAATGNFNAGATWVGGIVPGVGDEARASTTHVITITASVTCTELSNAGTGTYVLNNGVTLTANVTHKSATITVTLLTFSSASPATATIVGNCTGGSQNDGVAVANTSSGTLNITGNVTGVTSRAYGANNTNIGTITIVGNITGGSGGVNPYGVNNNSTGVINATGNVTGGSSATSNGIVNVSSGTIIVVGNISANVGSGLVNSSTGVLVITGDITAANSASGLTSANTAASVKISGSLIGSANGFPAVYASKYLVDPTPTTAKFRQAKNGSTTYSDFFTADNSLGQAAITDVRFGTVYASGALTGVAYIPSASSVAFGVPVDATTGTATLTAADVRAALGMANADLDTQLAALPTAAENADAVWDEATSGHTTAGTYGGRVVRSTNANNELQLTGSHHAAADVHEFQAAVIQSVAFATSAVTLFTGAMRTELTPELTEITEVHAIHGLDIANALTVTPTSRTSGAITQSITGDGTTNTVVTRV